MPEGTSCHSSPNNSCLISAFHDNDIHRIFLLEILPFKLQSQRLFSQYKWYSHNEKINIVAGG